jgi:DNA (cytosine-5)-methyltransferase 1
MRETRRRARVSFGAPHAERCRSNHPLDLLEDHIETLHHRLRMKRTRPAAVDLFSGAGGFGLGFKFGGFDVQLSVEIDAWACDTLRFNDQLMKVWQGDIRDLRNDDAIREVCPWKPEVIIGGPPCQGFSIAGPAKKDPRDPRNSLFMNFAHWVEALRPECLVLENVKGLLSRRNAQGEPVIDIITRAFRKLDYTVEVWLLNAAEYGIPQFRERIFVVGHCLPEVIGPPPPTHTANSNEFRGDQPEFIGLADLEQAITLWDAISDLPALEAGEGDEVQPYVGPPETDYQRRLREHSPYIYNHAAMHHSKRLVERFKHIRWGESSSDVPTEHGARKRNGNGQLSQKNYDQNNRRLHPHRPSHTIAASFYANFVHPFQHRNLTTREGARIQSFPDAYRFLGKKTVVSHRLLQREERFEEKFLCQYNQVGNAVPPLLAKAVAQHLGERLRLCSYMDRTSSKRNTTLLSTPTTIARSS